MRARIEKVDISGWNQSLVWWIYSRISIGDRHTQGYWLLKQDPETNVHNSDLLNLIPCEFDLTSTTFCDTTMITYEIKLPPSGKKVGFNLLDDEDFTTPYITNTIPNWPADNKLTTQDKRNVWIISINGEEPITDQGALDELNNHKNPCGKSKVNISLCRRNSYQITDIEDIHSIFYQFRPVVSHSGVCLPKKYPTPKKICEVLKGPQRQFWKEALFVQYDKNKNVRLLLAPITIK